MGMGIKLRLSQQFELFIQSNAQTNGTNLFRSPRTFLPLTSIDHQPIQPETKREWLFQHQLGIKFSFAPKRTNFKASVISPSVETYQGEVKSEVVTNGLAPSMSDSLQGRSAPEDEIPGRRMYRNQREAMTFFKGISNQERIYCHSTAWKASISNQRKCPITRNRMVGISSRSKVPLFSLFIKFTQSTLTVIRITGNTLKVIPKQEAKSSNRIGHGTLVPKGIQQPDKIDLTRSYLCRSLFHGIPGMQPGVPIHDPQKVTLSDR